MFFLFWFPKTKKNVENKLSSKSTVCQLYLHLINKIIPNDYCARRTLHKHNRTKSSLIELQITKLNYLAETVTMNILGRSELKLCMVKQPNIFECFFKVPLIRAHNLACLHHRSFRRLHDYERSGIILLMIDIRQTIDVVDTLDVYGLLIKYSQLHIFRAVEPMLTRRYKHR